MNKALESRLEDEGILRIIDAGQLKAYDLLVKRYQSKIYSVALSILKDDQDARDVTQDAFILAYENLNRFRRDSGFYTWLYRIARNQCHKYLDKRNQVKVDFRVEGDSALKLLERRELNERVRAAISQLPPAQRMTISLRDIERLSYAEISEITGVPEATVGSRLYHGRKKLKEILRGQNL